MLIEQREAAKKGGNRDERTSKEGHGDECVEKMLVLSQENAKKRGSYRSCNVFEGLDKRRRDD